MKTIFLKITAGLDIGLFLDIYTDLDFNNPIETHVSRIDLENGYYCYLVPDQANVIRIRSTGICDQYVDYIINLVPIPTPIPTPICDTYEFIGYLGYDAVNPNVCTHSPDQWCAGDISDFAIAEVLYKDSLCTYADAGYYSFNGIWRYWGGSNSPYFGSQSYCPYETLIVYTGNTEETVCGSGTITVYTYDGLIFMSGTPLFTNTTCTIPITGNFAANYGQGNYVYSLVNGVIDYLTNTQC